MKVNNCAKIKSYCDIEDIFLLKNLYSTLEDKSFKDESYSLIMLSNYYSFLSLTY